MVSQLVEELYARICAREYDFTSIGVRYFNVTGKPQGPDGAYAAVIRKWTAFSDKGQRGAHQRRWRDQP